MSTGGRHLSIGGGCETGALPEVAIMISLSPPSKFVSSVKNVYITKAS
jgi:hypothetical protein